MTAVLELRYHYLFLHSRHTSCWKQLVCEAGT